VDKLQPEKLPPADGKAEDAIKGQREVDYLEAGTHLATLYDGELLGPGMSFTGPAIIEEAEATIVIPPGLPCHVDEYGNYQISMVQGGSHE
jgi:N-methylhydantoinase A